MSNPYRVVHDFEAELCRYTGAPFAVTTTSCTMAILLAVAFHLRLRDYHGANGGTVLLADRKRAPWWNTEIEIPRRTYVGVPMSIIHAGGRPRFREEIWSGTYQLKPLPVWDSARRFTGDMYREDEFQCVSFHWSKTLGIQQGGAILHDDPDADEWLRRARFDGRAEGVPASKDVFSMLGWHCYMAPETAAAGLMRLALLAQNNPDLPWDDYPDLSTMRIFQ